MRKQVANVGELFGGDDTAVQLAQRLITVDDIFSPELVDYAFARVGKNKGVNPSK